MRFRQRLLWVASALLAACGGSGGGSDVPLDETVFSGTYRAVVFSASGSPLPGFASSLVAPWDALGDGSGSLGAGSVNSNGSVGPFAGGLALAYTVSGSGRLVANLPLVVFEGGIAREGDVFALAASTAIEEPSITIGLRSGGALGNASLSGTYGVVLLRYSGTGTDAVTVGDVTCDGSGALTFSAATQNAHGIVTPFPAPVAGTYAVASDGELDLAAASGRAWQGSVLAGGRLAVLGGAFNAGGEPELMLLLRRDLGPATDALFSGAYHVVGLRLDAPDFPGPPTPFTQVAVLRGEAVADGAGTIQANFTVKSEGTLFADSGPTDYRVNANGVLTMEDVAGAFGGPSARGAITSDGRFAAVGGSILSGQSPSLLFFVRK